MKMHPDKLGKYPITGVLGEGAMGVVYEALDPVINRRIAIKTIHRQLAGVGDDTASYADRFRNEAQAVGRLSHPGIVQIYEYGEDEDVAFIAMEFVQGRTLSQLLATTPRPNEPTIVRVMAQLLDALACAHSAGVWHRDIKPANIIITDRGQLKLTDFGIARIETNALTQVTAIIGTPGYISPEQYLGLPLDHRIDIFAAGVLLYRMLTGNSPFAGAPEAVMYKTVNEQPSPPSVVEGARRHPAFDAIVARALAKKPEDRYQSAFEFRRALVEAEMPAVAAPRAGDPADATVVVPRSTSPDMPTVPNTGAGTATSPASGGTLLQAANVAGWDAAVLAPIERSLAELLGPMAKLLVRKAATRCTDMPALIASVAELIGDSKERAAFVQRVSADHGTATGPGTAVPTTPTQAGAPATDPGGPLPSAVISHALRVLTSQMGPVARLVVKGAAAKARSVTEFHEILLDEVEDSVDSRKLLKLLKAGPE
jgi:tRNA A-37 threonylcarbamoyl transferase component Bud32